MIKIPCQVAILLKRLEESGHEAFAVGGCVRDSILGRTPGDWDICTNAEPEAMKSCFADFRVIETGLKHGTLTVVMEGQSFEITTYRIDGNYSDGRHPDEVVFTSQLREDLERRDFTINAMAYHPEHGLIDPLGGREDLKRGCIRCVGNADRRFQEDGLRIMRALRFAAQLNFEIEEKTAASLYSCRHLLKRISAERIRTEFDKLLCSPGSASVLAEYREIITCIIPEIRPMFELDQRNQYHIYTVWDHTLCAVSHIGNSIELKLAAFFHDIGKPESMTVDEKGVGHFYRHEVFSEALAEQIMLRLKYDNRTRETVLTLIRSHNIVFRPSCKQARRLLGRLGEENLRRLIELEYADVKSQNPAYICERVVNIQAFSHVVDEVLKEEQCFSLRRLALNGTDLLLMGFSQGPEIGNVLNALLEQVIEENLPNERERLMKAAEAFL